MKKLKSIGVILLLLTGTGLIIAALNTEKNWMPLAVAGIATQYVAWRIRSSKGSPVPSGEFDETKKRV